MIVPCLMEKSLSGFEGSSLSITEQVVVACQRGRDWIDTGIEWVENLCPLILRRIMVKESGFWMAEKGWGRHGSDSTISIISHILRRWKLLKYSNLCLTCLCCKYVRLYRVGPTYPRGWEGPSPSSRGVYY